MADAEWYRAEGILIFDATDEMTFDAPRKVTRLYFNSTAQGNFVIVFGNVPITVTNTTAQYYVDLPVERHVNYLKLTSGPTAAKMYAFLEKK